MANSSNSFYLVQGKKSNSGSDRVYDAMADQAMNADRMEAKRWTMIGGAKISPVPDKIFFAGQDEYFIIAYDKKDMTLIAWWNKTKKEGSSISALHLIFNTYGLVGISLSAGLVYYLSKIHPTEMLLIYIACAAVTGVAYIIAFFNWKVKKAAQDKVNELKNV